MTGADISRLTSLCVWYLGNPAIPAIVGTVSLIPGTTRCSFVYADEWVRGGFPLSPDMPFGRAIITPSADSQAPGALEDAMPDRWGQSTIRIVDRPRRLTALDFLYYSGDHRFGALGVSTSPDAYLPCPADPILGLASLEEAKALIERILAREPLNHREKRLLQSGRSLGGAQPKVLVTIDGEPWIAKFPNGSNVDQPLIEHASLSLAREIGIKSVCSRVHPIGSDHVVMTRRFDRIDGRRLHALSAKTMLLEEGDESYAAIATVIRAFGEPDPTSIDRQRHELFRRMVFNILIDNTDDHTKNHAFVRNDRGYYDLAPCYDIPPQMNGLGQQAIPIRAGRIAWDRSAAVETAASFGLSRDEANDIWQQVADGVSRWKDVFSETGVLGVDIDYLTDFIDSDDKLALRAFR